MERSYTEFKGQCYETFYFREDSQIISYRFEYSEEKECDNVKIFIYKDGLLQYIYSAFEEHYSEERGNVNIFRCRNNHLWDSKKNHKYKKFNYSN